MEQVSEWLEQLKGQSLLIYKEEIATGKQEVMDIDQVSFKLDSVSFNRNRHANIDDYLAFKEIVLYGQGTIQTDQGESGLPERAYEIPLTGDFKTEKNADNMRVETDQAIYTISVQ